MLIRLVLTCFNRFNLQAERSNALLLQDRLRDGRVGAKVIPELLHFCDFKIFHGICCWRLSSKASGAVQATPDEFQVSALCVELMQLMFALEKFSAWAAHPDIPKHGLCDCRFGTIFVLVSSSARLAKNILQRCKNLCNNYADSAVTYTCSTFSNPCFQSSLSMPF